MSRNTCESQLAEQLRKEKIQSLAMVHFLVSEDGFTSDIHLAMPTGRALDEDALKVAESCRFTPARLYGVAVPFELTVELNLMRNLSAPIP